jgi:hypothetical protein
MESKGHWGKGMNTGKLSEMVNYGQAAPASSSSPGSRQGLWSTPRSADARNPGLTNCKPGSMLHLGTQAARQELWLTPRANEPDSDPNFAARNADRGTHCHGTLSSQAKSEQWATPSTADTNRMWKPETLERRKAEGKVAQMGLNYQAVKLWPTITAHTPDMESNGPNGHQGTYLAGAVKQWATPAARDTQGQRGAAANARKGNPLDTLPNQMAQWGTPTARDHKSGRGNEDRQYKELTPMVERASTGKLNPRWVETLMGLPIGWTMPSCTSPQTIELMSCDFLATELSRPPQSELSEFSLAS